MTRLTFLRLLGLTPVTRYGSMGQMHRRPDQQTDAPPTAVAPSQAAGIVRARLVLIFGTGANTGLFVYNGTPAKGNLIAQIVPPGVTTDPYGNSVATVANFGHWNAAGALLRHFGIDQNGNTYLANASGLTVVFENSSDGSIQFYNTSGAGLGNLVASIAPASGTDPSGNAYQPGLVSYSGNILGELVSAALRFFNQSSAPSSPPTVFSADAAVAGARITTSSGKGTAGATQAVLTLADSLLGTGGAAQAVIGTAAAPITAFTSALLEVQGTIGTTLIKAIVSGALETWHAASLAAGFSAGSPAPRFQLEPVNGGRVRLAGIVNLTATEAAGTTIFTLPAGYLPAQFHSFVTSNSLSGYTLGARAIQVNNLGQVQLGSSGVNTNFVVLDGICFELD